MTTIDEIEKLMTQKTSELLEHVESVRIFCTFHDGSTEESKAIDHGGGNFYAQLGQVQEWLDIQRQYQKNWAIRNDEAGR